LIITDGFKQGKMILGITIIKNGKSKPEIGNHHLCIDGNKNDYIVFEKKWDTGDTFHYELHYMPFIHNTVINELITCINNKKI
jgi:hypothetical protein